MKTAPPLPTPTPTPPTYRHTRKKRQTCYKSYDPFADFYYWTEQKPFFMWVTFSLKRMCSLENGTHAAWQTGSLATTKTCLKNIPPMKAADDSVFQYKRANYEMMHPWWEWQAAEQSTHLVRTTTTDWADVWRSMERVRQTALPLKSQPCSWYWLKSHTFIMHHMLIKTQMHGPHS